MPRTENASRNTNGSGSIRKITTTSKGKEYTYWQARYTAGYDPVTGKQMQRSITGKTKKEVAQKLRQATMEVDQDLYHEPCRLTVSQWLNTWLEEYIGNVKPSTVKSYTDHVRLNLTPYIGNIRLSKLKADAVQRLYNRLRREKGLSPKTIQNLHAVLHRALEQARKLGYIAANPLAAVTLPRIEKAPIRPLDSTDLRRFLQVIQGTPYEYIYYVAVFTGLRQAELLGLTWDCVNFENGTLWVNKQHGLIKGTSQYAFSSLKNSRPRMIQAADSVMEVLRKQHQRQQQWAEAMGDAWDNADDLVFTTNTGRYITNCSLYDSFKRLMVKLGLPNVRFHDLRHTFAVNSLRAGDDIKTVQNNLGHHTAAFTLDTYAHVTGEMQRESAGRMERFIRSVS